MKLLFLYAGFSTVPTDPVQFLRFSVISSQRAGEIFGEFGVRDLEEIFESQV